MAGGLKFTFFPGGKACKIQILAGLKKRAGAQALGAGRRRARGEKRQGAGLPHARKMGIRGRKMLLALCSHGAYLAKGAGKGCNPVPYPHKEIFGVKGHLPFCTVHTLSLTTHSCPVERGRRLPYVCRAIIKKRAVMKTCNPSNPTESRRFSVFSHFRNSKRVRWAEARNYVH